MGVGLLLEHRRRSKTHTFKKMYFLSLQPIANNSLAMGGISYPIPLALLGFGQSWVCTGFMHAVTNALSSCSVALTCSESTVSL